MLPPEEIRMLEATVRDAWKAGAEGRVTEGYAMLDLGLLWAETPALDSRTLEQGLPEPWSEELTALYRAALMRYVAEFAAEAPPAFCEEPILEATAAPGVAGASRSPLHPSRRALCERARMLQERAAQLCAVAALHRRQAEAARQRCAERRRMAAELRLEGRGRAISATGA